MTEEESLAEKQKWLDEKLMPWSERSGKVSSLKGNGRLAYRTKVCLATEWTNEGWTAGLRHGDDIIPAPDCPVHHPDLNYSLAGISRVCPPFELWPMVYLVQSGRQLCFVLKSSVLPDVEWLTHEAGALLSRQGEYIPDGIWIHLHPSAGRKVFLKFEWRHIWGREYSTDESGLKYGPMTFQQVLPGLHETAFSSVNDFLCLGPGSAVVDLYCGNGNSLRRWTGSGALTLGVELNGEALRFAGINAPLARLLRGKCSQRIPQMNSFLEERIDPEESFLLFANPPRTGLEREVTEWICKVRPVRFAYLSCSAGTLRRDLLALAEGGYTVKGILPFDFFPQTHHVETLALLSREA
jgi:23S rRNA (uracil1939-C5)-methyltransferase